MKEIPLTKGKVAYVSDIDYPEVRERKWHCYSGYAATWNCGKHILPHRFIAVLKGIDDAEEIDHIDGNTYNCIRSNLRAVTHQQNCMNRHSISAKSGVKGVYPNTGGHWIARLKLDGKIINLGTYDTIPEAAEARRKGALKHYGKFANKVHP